MSGITVSFPPFRVYLHSLRSVIARARNMAVGEAHLAVKAAVFHRRDDRADIEALTEQLQAAHDRLGTLKHENALLKDRLEGARWCLDGPAGDGLSGRGA